MLAAFGSTIIPYAIAAKAMANQMEAVAELTHDKTVIMIAHRLKTVRSADQILVLDQGRIVQRGTHGELIGQEGIYRNFVTQRAEAGKWSL